MNPKEVIKPTSLPLLLIGGAPKCGTSSLFDWLSQHPQISPSKPKEPFFLIERDSPLRAITKKTLPSNKFKDYEELFQPTGDSKLFIEGTTHYLYSQFAAENAKFTSPNTKAVFVIRKPSQRIKSSFYFTKHNLGHIDPNFGFPEYAKLLLSQQHDQIKKHISNSVSAHVLINDLAYSDYLPFIKTWEENLSKEKVTIILFEDLVRKPKQILKEILSNLQLDISQINAIHTSSSNKTLRTRLPGLHSKLRSLANLKLLAGLKNPIARKLYQAIQYSNPIQTTDEDRGAMQILDNHFESINQSLAVHLGRNLTIWD